MRICQYVCVQGMHELVGEMSRCCRRSDGWNRTGESGTSLTSGFVVVGYPLSYCSWVISLALGLLVAAGMTVVALDISWCSLLLAHIRIGELLLYIGDRLLYFIDIGSKELVDY